MVGFLAHYFRGVWVDWIRFTRKGTFNKISENYMADFLWVSGGTYYRYGLRLEKIIHLVHGDILFCVHLTLDLTIPREFFVKCGVACYWL